MIPYPPPMVPNPRGFDADGNPTIYSSQVHKANSIIMQIRIPPNYGNRYRKEFESIYTEIAEETKSLYMPLRFLMV